MDRDIEREVSEIAQDQDRILVVSGVTWDEYEKLLRVRGTCRLPHFAYLDGELEVGVTTSVRHELGKTLLARLVEMWAVERDVELIGMGEATFRKKVKRAGLEPDECYCVDRVRAVPELAIEVVHTSGGIDKLEIYRRLGVGEVWFWIAGELQVHRSINGVWRRRARSGVLPGIDIGILQELVANTPDDQQTTAVRNFQRLLRQP